MMCRQTNEDARTVELKASAFSGLDNLSWASLDSCIVESRDHVEGKGTRRRLDEH